MPLSLQQIGQRGSGKKRQKAGEPPPQIFSALSCKFSEQFFVNFQSDFLYIFRAISCTFSGNFRSEVWPLVDKNIIKLRANDESSFGAIHKGRPHPRGEGGRLVKSGHMRTQGGGGVSGKMRTSSKFKFLPKFYQNFRILFSVSCPKRQHSTQ